MLQEKFEKVCLLVSYLMFDTNIAGLPVLNFDLNQDLQIYGGLEPA